MLAAVSVAVGVQAASLALLDTNPWKGGLRGLDQLAQTPALIALAVVAAGATGVAFTALTSARVRERWRVTLGQLGRWPMALVVVNALLGVAIVRPLQSYPVHVLLAATTAIATLLALLSAAADTPARLRHLATVRLAESERFRWYAASAVTIVSAAISTLVFDRIPHIPDEVVYLFQAKTLAAGHLSLAEMPGGSAWDMIYTMRHDGRWFGIFPPGWPVVLALGVAAGVPWLVNPVLAGLIVLVVHGLTRRLGGLAVANWTALLLATSPWFLFLGASMMSHTVSVLFAAIALNAAYRLSGRSSVTTGATPPDDAPLPLMVAGGAALGALVLTRPIEGVVVSLTIAAWLIVVRPRAAFGPRGLAMAAVALLTGALYLPYNAALTGRALLDPITFYFDRTFYPGVNRLGFGSTVGNVGWGNDVLPGHSVLEAVINANLNLHLVQLELFGWSVGSLFVVLAYLASRRRQLDRMDALMCGLIAMIVAVYAAYWYSGADFGPRYWSQLLVPAAVLSARGIIHLTAQIGEPLAQGTVSTNRVGSTWATALLLACLTGGPLVVAARSLGKYENYRGMTTAVRDFARDQRLDNALVLLRGNVFSDYAAGMTYNDAKPVDGRPVFARYVTGAELEALRAEFPDRSIWVVDGPSLTGGEPNATPLTGASSAAAH